MNTQKTSVFSTQKSTLEVISAENFKLVGQIFQRYPLSRAKKGRFGKNVSVKVKRTISCDFTAENCLVKTLKREGTKKEEMFSPLPC